MPELRIDPLTGRLVSYAPERAKRPVEFGSETQRPISDDRSRCPFCPGKEENLSPAVLVLVKGDMGLKFERESGEERKKNWLVKVIPNLYPAFSKDDVLLVGEERKKAPGIHEVVIDTPVHDAYPWKMSVDQLQYFLLTVRERLRQLEREPGITYACFGKNFGPHSGASLMHPHTHVFASSLTPPIILREAEKLSGENCLLCGYVKEISGPRAILSTKGFAAVCPWASREPYEVMVFPKEHWRRFTNLGDQELFELANMLSTIFKAMWKVLGDFSFNMVLHTKPRDVDDFHWHIEIIPRLLAPMVSEVGLEVYVNTVFPEDAAEKLRSAIKQI
ncbi:MAG: hypothetical protein J7J94_03970 [Thaumarchaeota archaeon]|nr:hypothetical protein [Nitrososphaerota archaeon]